MELNLNMPGSLLSEADLNAIDAVDGGIARGGTAEDFDFRAGEKAEMRQVIADFLAEIQAFHHARLPHPHFA